MNHTLISVTADRWLSDVEQPWIVWPSGPLDVNVPVMIESALTNGTKITGDLAAAMLKWCTQIHADGPEQRPGQLVQHQLDELASRGLITAESAATWSARAATAARRRNPFNEEIAEHRKAAGLTVEQAAEVVHDTPHTWQDWEAGIAKMHAGLWEFFVTKTTPKLLQRSRELPTK